MNKVIITAYFGKLPNYFPLFVQSCASNNDFDFLLFTDQEVSVDILNNFQVVKISFQATQNLVKKKLGEDCNLYSPYKLCDYKPAYGKIFEDYIEDYSVWGHCDMDLIFGNISKFISDDTLAKYDRLLMNGHLTFYQNSEKVNNFYLLENSRYISFKDAVKIQEPCFFDEISLPGILESHGVKIYRNWNFLDILPQKFNMTAQVYGDVANYEDQTFYYDDGQLIQEYTLNGSLKTREFMYIHLQKRKMEFNLDELNPKKRCYINSNIFTNDKNDSSVKNPLLYSSAYYFKQLKKINLSRLRIKLKILINRSKDDILV